MKRLLTNPVLFFGPQIATRVTIKQDRFTKKAMPLNANNANSRLIQTVPRHLLWNGWKLFLIISELMFTYNLHPNFHMQVEGLGNIFR